LDESNSLEIYEARHPVVEAQLDRGEFIPNDIIINCRDCSPTFALITGPNMAGKSTYLRSAALLVIMAQTGSFIPAREGRIGICDRIYCRVGASDNLARGESTFLVEMNETAYILNTATENSLVIMDEVGRGTGTNDGLSIAWAVSDELLNRIKCRTFFATHYHELSLMRHPFIVNRSMEVLEKDGGIIFMRKLREGSAAESYGIHVARLAGLSQAVLARAEQIMEQLRERDISLRKAMPGNFDGNWKAENKEATNDAKNAIVKKAPADSAKSDENVSPPPANEIPAAYVSILQDMFHLDPNRLTPLEALALVNEWKQRLSETEIVPEAIDLARPQKSKSGLPFKKNEPSLFD
jgi:DNA mismatch repair protein MutS